MSMQVVEFEGQQYLLNRGALDAMPFRFMAYDPAPGRDYSASFLTHRSIYPLGLPCRHSIITMEQTEAAEILDEVKALWRKVMHRRPRRLREKMPKPKRRGKR